MSQIPGLLLLALMASAPAHATEFETIDSNDDGRVSSSEYEVHVREIYDRMDGNADDKLTKAEVQASEAMFLRHVFAGGALLGATAEPSTEEKLKRLDANQDGLISQGEYANAGAAKFRRMDLNSNGELSSEEFAVAG